MRHLQNLYAGGGRDSRLAFGKSASPSLLGSRSLCQDSIAILAEARPPRLPARPKVCLQGNDQECSILPKISVTLEETRMPLTHPRMGLSGGGIRYCRLPLRIRPRQPCENQQRYARKKRCNGAYLEQLARCHTLRHQCTPKQRTKKRTQPANNLRPADPRTAD